MTTIRPKSKSKSRSTPTTSRPYIPSSSGAFSSTKRDKRQIKHSILLSKVQKSAKPTLKRRRPSKKLVTNLEALAHALPDFEDNDTGHSGIGSGDRGGSALADQVKIRHKSLKSRPGAMKRKEKLERLERERFGRNMAEMVKESAPTQTHDMDSVESSNGTATANRWAALRSFIGATMEKKEFRK